MNTTFADPVAPATARPAAATPGQSQAGRMDLYASIHKALRHFMTDTLTRGERTLVAAGESEAVLDLRRRWQRVMRDSCSRKIEQLTGRKVIGFMSDNHIDPDIAVEVFILEPVDAAPGAQAAIAVADPVPE